MKQRTGHVTQLKRRHFKIKSDREMERGGGFRGGRGFRGRGGGGRGGGGPSLIHFSFLLNMASIWTWEGWGGSLEDGDKTRAGMKNEALRAAFQEFQSRLDARHDKHERIVKLSRFAQSLSKGKRQG